MVEATKLHKKPVISCVAYLKLEMNKSRFGA